MKSINENRELFLSELRSGKYKKGTIRSDEKGFPIIESPEDNDGCCACGLMVMLFPSPTDRGHLNHARKQLGLTAKDCRYIQQELNDTTLSFIQIADIIDKEVFVAGTREYFSHANDVENNRLRELVYEQTGCKSPEELNVFVKQFNNISL